MLENLTLRGACIIAVLLVLAVIAGYRIVNLSWRDTNGNGQIDPDE